MPAETVLFEETIRRKLEPLSLVASSVRAGAMKGDRRSKKRGTSVEFADYRNYTAGDDLRRLDWNVFARHDKAVVKLLEDEEDLAVHIVIDTSASMDFPKPDSDSAAHNKLNYARRIAAGLGYIGLSENDRLTLSTLATGEVFGPTRGRASLLRMFQFLHALEGQGTTDLNSMLANYAAKATRPGLFFLISDFFSENGFVNGLNQLIGRGHEVVIMHVLSPDEVNPAHTGDLRLIDSETGAAQEVSLDAGLVSLYRQRLEAWQSEIRSECTRRGAVYLAATTDSAWEHVILQGLRRAGVVR